MTYTETSAPLTANPGWLRRAEAWLDNKGKGAWIAAMILGFIFVWPVGLALLIYMIWSNRMFGCSKRKSSTHFKTGFSALRPSGNAAFDSYKAETLRRLEDEQQQFEDFLKRLRDARDKAEFDDFMEERAKKAKTVETEDA